ncbi:MAG: hypothetical protein KJ065_12110 [Anaerolineae bacterium]|nr:hypothetical protein [Anaerolineae bacterium]
MNRTTHIIFATIGIVLAISGMSHGFFETQQGNTPTNGLIINAIGDAQKMWEYGGETAFTLIPNFLVTGIAAIAVGIAIIIWSLGFLRTKHGPTGFLLLFILLFLVGGGIGQVPLFLVAWAFGTRVNKPLTWWRRALPEAVREPLSKIWPVTLAVGALLFLLALAIAIFGDFLGIGDPEQLIGIVFASLGVGLAFFVLSYVSGFAHDIEEQADSRLRPAMS